MKREPLFNIPPVIVAVLAVLAFIHALRTLVLTNEQDIEFIFTFAFIPARYDSSALLGGAVPGGFGAEIWSFVTYSLIHADWTHFGVNAIWLLPFGSAVARRFGASRFLAFYAVTAAAGAAMHLLTHAGEPSPMIGASAAISGTMAAAMRFAFQRGGPLDFWPRRRRPIITCRQSRSPACCAISACSLSWRSGSGSIFYSGLVPCRSPAETRWSPGRPILAASWPGCFCFPGSIPSQISSQSTISMQRGISQAVRIA